MAPPVDMMMTHEYFHSLIGNMVQVTYLYNTDGSKIGVYVVDGRFIFHFTALPLEVVKWPSYLTICIYNIILTIMVPHTIL